MGRTLRIRHRPPKQRKVAKPIDLADYYRIEPFPFGWAGLLLAWTGLLFTDQPAIGLIFLFAVGWVPVWRILRWNRRRVLAKRDALR